MGFVTSIEKISCNTGGWIAYTRVGSSVSSVCRPPVRGRRRAGWMGREPRRTDVMEEEDAKCPQCGAGLSADQSEGLCVACAVRSALDDASGPTQVGGVEAVPIDEQKFGPYQPIRLLGEGGFGQVFLALQTEPFRRHVALKVLKPGMGGRDVVARFELERQALARMDHPGICKIYDAGETGDGRPYFVMEVCEGPSITKYCRGKNLPLREMIPLYRQVCDAVHHAHQRGVIHRDLKPSNILVTEKGGKRQATVIDFGIAKALEPLLASDTMLTQSFQILGTPSYMSPEQAETGGHDADVRSDVYALGAVFYELLTGSPPVKPEDIRKAGIAAGLRLISEGDTPPPSARLADLKQNTDDFGGLHEPARRVRGDLDWIAMKALAKSRERRYQSADDLGEDLGGSSGVSRSPPVRRESATGLANTCAAIRR